MTENPQILVVDDDNRLRNLLKKYLSENGFSVCVANSASNARKVLEKENISLIVLDVMMPDETGVEFAISLRKNQNTIPILMLTAMGEPEDRISGLETGIDDYLIKPFEPRELLLRISNILRRYNETVESPISEVIFGDFIFNIERLTLEKLGVSVHLTSGETDLLKVLAENAGNPVKREQFSEHSGVNISDRSIDVQILRLRKKIEDDPRQPKYLRTIRHKGYVLQVDK